MARALASCGSSGDADSGDAWLKEPERRLGELENGTARTFPADDVIKEAQTLLK
jgi:hypothetical protein